MSPLAKLRLLATQASPRLSTIRTDAPSGLTDLVAELLARNPDERPASAAHLAEALRPFCEGADLSALATKARVATEKSIDETPENLAASLPKLPIDSRSSLQENRLTPALQSNAGRSHRWWWAIAAALAPLAIVAGIVIALETQKGKLIIESDNANVSVKLLRDGVVYEQLKVEPGQQETRLYAGRYQVTIDGSSDGIVLDGEQIEVRQGKTAIARIRRESSSAPLPATNPPTILASDEATYEGHPLSYWMAEFEREKSADGLKKSLTAIEKLLPPEKASFVTDQLLKNDMQLLRDNVFNAEEFRDFFRRANPGAAYPRMLIRELEKIDASSKRLFMRLCFKHPNSMKDFYEFSEFRGWMEGSVFAGKQPELLADCALLYLGMLTDSRFTFSRSEYLSLYDALDKSDQLGTPFWFAMSSDRFHSDAWNAFPLASAEDQAMTILEDPKSTRNDVALASAWLRIKGESIHGRESAIAKAICNQLRVQLPKIGDSNGHEVYVGHWFDFDLLCLSGQQSLIPNLKIVKVSEPARGKKNHEKLFPTLELLALAKSYPSDDLKDLLNELLKLMDNSRLASNNSGEPMTLYWPSMVSPQFSVNPSRWEHILIRKYARILKEELSPNENPEETETGTPSEAKPSDGPSPTTIPTEPMTATFKGRTLEQWLSLVKVEQSADGLADAFDGMAGLVSPETSPKVLEATLEILRSGRGVGDQARQSTSGFKLLRLCAGEGYGKLLTDEMATENKDWSLRILVAVHAARSNSGKWEPEHLAVLNWLTDANHKTAVPFSSLVFSMLADDELPATTVDTLFLAADKQFGIDFLLHAPLSSPDLKLASSMPKLIDLAMSKLSDENSDPKMVALAATFLGQRAESIPPQKLPDVISFAERRLMALAANKESLIAITNPDAPPVGINSLKGDLQIRGQLSVPDLPQFSQSISLLALIFYLGSPTSSEPSVQSVLDMTAGSREAVRGVLAASNRDNVLVGWPFLESFQSEQADFVSKLAPDVWREACVHAVAELVMGSIANTKSLQSEVTDPEVLTELANAKRFMAQKDKTGQGRILLNSREFVKGFLENPRDEIRIRRFDEDRNGEISITEYARFLASKKSQESK